MALTSRDSRHISSTRPVSRLVFNLTFARDSALHTVNRSSADGCMLVQELGGFEVKRRGLVEVKGKGPLELYQVLLRTRLAPGADASIADIRQDAAQPSFMRPRALSTLSLGGFEQLRDTVANAGATASSGGASAPEARILRWPAKFEDEGVEADFARSHAGIDRLGLTVGLLLHVLCVLWQCLVVVAPPNPSYFDDHGDEHLSRNMSIVFALLMAHLGLVLAASSCTLLFLWGDKLPDDLAAAVGCSCAGALAERDERTQHLLKRLGTCSLSYLALKLVFFAASLVASALWHVQASPLAIIGVVQLINFGHSHNNFGINDRLSTLLWLVSAGALVVWIMLVAMGLWAFGIAEFLLHVGLLIGAFAMSGLIERTRRQLWWHHHQHKKDLEGISGILGDLLPVSYVPELVKGCSHVPYTQVRVVVLQLDIVGFTKLSSSMPHVALADLINTLFSEFDEYVIGRDLFKLDTVGDAYLLVGWLPDDNINGTREKRGLQGQLDPKLAAQSACSDVLAVAEAMIHTIRQHCLESGQDLGARIGITVGPAVGGVFGGFPRFAVLGRAMWEVAELEQAGVRDHVHCSAGFLDILRESGDGGLAAWNVVARQQRGSAAGGGNSSSRSQASDTTSESCLDIGALRVELDSARDEQVPAPSAQPAALAPHRPSVCAGAPPSARHDPVPSGEHEDLPGQSTYILAVQEGFEDLSSVSGARRILFKVGKDACSLGVNAPALCEGWALSESRSRETSDDCPGLCADLSQCLMCTVVRSPPEVWS